VPYRRVLALLATVTLLSGCEIELDPGAIPPPISIAPTPSASAGVPKYVCSQTYKILTEGAVRLLQQANASGVEAEAAMRQTITGMATQVDEELTRTTDPGLREALQAISADLTAGAQQPKTYATGDFSTVGQKLDGHCD
jgi:hypothetical protein